MSVPEGGREKEGCGRGRVGTGREIRTLADQEADADPGHVEAVEPMLDVEVDVACVLTALPLEDALCDGGDGWVVALLDGLEGFCEGAVVLANLGGPFLDGGCVGVVSVKRNVGPEEREGKRESNEKGLRTG